MTENKEDGLTLYINSTVGDIGTISLDFNGCGESISGTKDFTFYVDK
jgi:hypothetical protein